MAANRREGLVRGTKRPRVAVVGDNSSLALVTLTLCEHFGCDTEEVRSSDNVIALLGRTAAVDAIVIDLAMRGVGALQTVRLIREIKGAEAPPVVALSDRREACGVPFQAEVSKPFSPRELYDALEKALFREKVKYSS